MDCPKARFLKDPPRSIPPQHTWVRGVLRQAGLLISLVLVPGWSGAQQPTAQAQPTLPRIWLQTGMHRIHAELADTPETRQLGMMHRTTMKPGEGMLFRFGLTDRHCFWMRNTPLPLSIAFVDDSGRIVNIEEMSPLSDESHCPKAPVRYALEMRQGWFQERGVRAGALIQGLDENPKGAKE